MPRARGRTVWQESRHCLARGDERPLAAAGGQQPALASRGNERGVRPEEVREMLRFGFVRGDERRKPCRIICTTTLWLRARGRTVPGDAVMITSSRFGFARVGERHARRTVRAVFGGICLARGDKRHAHIVREHTRVVFASRAGANGFPVYAEIYNIRLCGARGDERDVSPGAILSDALVSRGDERFGLLLNLADSGRFDFARRDERSRAAIDDAVLRRFDFARGDERYGEVYGPNYPIVLTSRAGTNGALPNPSCPRSRFGFARG